MRLVSALCFPSFTQLISLHFTSFHFLFSLSLPTDRQLPQGTVNTTGVTLDLPRACPPPHLFLLHSYTYIFISSFHLFLSLSEKVFLNIDNYSSGSHLSTYVIHTSLYLSWTSLSCAHIIIISSAKTTVGYCRYQYLLNPQVAVDNRLW